MTTKEQEFKALEQIREIVAELGEDSYIATAFEGVLEDAEENIRCDFGVSMKERLDIANNEIAKQRENIRIMQSKIEELASDKQHLINQMELRERDAKSANEAWTTASKKAVDLEDKVAALASVLDRRDTEIMKLKAKLYDLLVD